MYLATYFQSKNHGIIKYFGYPHWIERFWGSSLTSTYFDSGGLAGEYLCVLPCVRKIAFGLLGRTLVPSRCGREDAPVINDDVKFKPAIRDDKHRHFMSFMSWRTVKKVSCWFYLISQFWTQNSAHTQKFAGFFPSPANVISTSSAFQLFKFVSDTFCIIFAAAFDKHCRLCWISQLWPHTTKGFKAVTLW